MTTDQAIDFDLDHTQDVFDDTENTEAETETETQETEQETETQAEEQETETGEKETSEETPAEENKEESEAQDDETVPMHRFKAALKDANSKLDAANQEIAQLKAKPAPDPEEDPEGYQFHLRMETSKAVMRESKDDYDETIAHYQEMAKANPQLNAAVAAHPAPAKYAYELAKEDMKVREARELQGSDEWKEFQAWKASQKTGKKEEENQAVADNLAGDAGEQKKVKQEAPKVPNLNRQTDVSGKQPVVQQDDDELFEGAL
jgi:hypothetical protein